MLGFVMQKLRISFKSYMLISLILKDSRVQQRSTMEEVQFDFGSRGLPAHVSPTAAMSAHQSSDTTGTPAASGDAPHPCDRPASYQHYA